MPSQNIALYYTEGSSDKVYQIHMEERDGGFVVYGMNGKRGASLKVQPKTDGPVSESEASKIYDALLKTQLKKGYTPMESGIRFQGTERANAVTGLLPQLCNEIDEATAERLIEDDNWMAQQKIDGERRMMKVDAEGAVGSNRQGLAAPLPLPVAEALQALGHGVGLDGEALGAKVVVFDLVSWAGEDWQGKGSEERYARLAEAIASLSEEHQACIELTPTAFTTTEKRALLEGCRHHTQEGLVFKRKDAPYVPNRPASGGDHLKLKFWNVAEVVFGEKNANKRSVPFFAHNEQGERVAIGNVTIPANADVPAEGSVGKVKYLYAFPNGGLFEPTFVGMSPDATPERCQTSDLTYKADHVCVQPQAFMRTSPRP